MSGLIYVAGIVGGGPGPRHSGDEMSFTRPRWALIGAASVVLTCIAMGAVTLRPAGAATGTTVDQTVGQAVAYAQSTGVASSIVVYDDRTGKIYAAGDYTSFYGSASVMKLFVATKLLASGQLRDPQIATQAWSMITRSDDAALEALLPVVGGVEVINWVKDYYGIPFLGTPSPTKPTCWGNTQISALGIAYFYHQMKHDPVVAPWLVNAMHHHEQFGADGTDQSFGIPQAAEHVGVKQGWGHCSSNTDGSVINSTGLVGSNRFLIAILTNTNNWTVDNNSFNATQAAVVTEMAKILMPYGSIDLPGAHAGRPVGNRTSAPSPAPDLGKVASRASTTADPTPSQTGR